MEPASISVVIPTRGRPEHVLRAAASVIGQDYAGWIEIIAVFDGGQPSGLELATSHARQLTLRSNGRTPGPAGARNDGVAASSGQLVAFLDDDDQWASDKLRRQAAVLNERPQAPAATCGVQIVARGRVFTRVPARDTITRGELLGSRRSEVHTSTLLIRRDAWERIGGFDETMPEGYGEDYDWLLRATELGPLAVERRPLVTIHVGESWFADRWDTIAAGVHEQLRRHPELERDRRNLARMYGRVAFAHAAGRRAREALKWSGRSMRLDPLQWRGYAATAVGLRLVSAERVARALAARGRGI